jgi:hypothetical protein
LDFFLVLDEGPVVKASISDKKSVVKMEPSKEFGSFSSLLAPALLSGKKTAHETIVAVNESEAKISSETTKRSINNSSSIIGMYQ